MELLNSLTGIMQFLGGGIAGIGAFTLVKSFHDQNPSARTMAFGEVATGLIIIYIAPEITNFIISYLPS